MAFGQLGSALGAGLSNVGRPRSSNVGRPRSIIGQALAGHPAWQSTPPRLIGTAGNALLGGTATLTGAPAAHPTAATALPAAATATTPPPPSPLDATYFSNVAAHDLATNNQINALDLRDANSLTNLQATLGSLRYQQPRDQLSLMQRANQSGGLYSSVEGMNQANVVHSFNQREDAAQTGYDQSHLGLASQIAALRAGVPVYNTGQAVDAANRAAVAAQNDPTAAANAVAPVAPAAPAGGGRAGGSAGGGRVRPGVGHAGSALLGNLGNLTRPQIGRAGAALSNRRQLAKALAGRRR